jgi:hypothetical protein
MVETRTGSQVRSHAQKFFNRLERGELKQKETPMNERKASYKSLGRIMDYIRVKSARGLYRTDSINPR